MLIDAEVTHEFNYLYINKILEEGLKVDNFNVIIIVIKLKITLIIIRTISKILLILYYKIHNHQKY